MIKYFYEAFKISGSPNANYDNFLASIFRFIRRIVKNALIVVAIIALLIAFFVGFLIYAGDESPSSFFKDMANTTAFMSDEKVRKLKQEDDEFEKKRWQKYTEETIEYNKKYGYEYK